MRGRGRDPENCHPTDPPTGPPTGPFLSYVLFRPRRGGGIQLLLEVCKLRLLLQGIHLRKVSPRALPEPSQLVPPFGSRVLLRRPRKLNLGPMEDKNEVLGTWTRSRDFTRSTCSRLAALIRLDGASCFRCDG